MKKALIVLPTYNEKENVITLIPAIFDITKNIPGWDVEILVVEDNSPDGTADVVKDLQKDYSKLHMIHGEKTGLGKAYQRGFAYGIKHIAPEIIFEMDSDWQHDPHIIPDFLKKIDAGADFVIGSRFIKGGSIPASWGLHRKIYSIGANIGMMIGFMKFSIHDWTSGFRAMRASFIEKTIHRYTPYDSYIFQIAILDNAVKEHLHIAEVPLNFGDRKIGVSKIPAFQYIFNIIFYVLQNSSFIRFAIVGFIGATIDFGGSFILHELLLFSIVISTICSGEMAFISNFLINNYWSFAHKKFSSKTYHFWKSFAKFHTVALGSIGIQTGLMYLATSMWNPRYWYVYKTFIIGFVIIPYSYFMYNKVIWKSQKNI